MHPAGVVVTPQRSQLLRLTSARSPTGPLPPPPTAAVDSWAATSAAERGRGSGDLPCQEFPAAASMLLPTVLVGAGPPWSPPLGPMTHPVSEGMAQYEIAASRVGASTDKAVAVASTATLIGWSAMSLVVFGSDISPVPGDLCCRVGVQLGVVFGI